MKIKERALSLLLSLVMVLTFMPALAFAEGDEPADANGTPAIEETTEAVEEASEEQSEGATVEAPEEDLVEAPLNTDSTPAARDVGENWSIEGIGGNTFLMPWERDEPDYYEPWVWAEGYSDGDKELQYCWFKDNTALGDWANLSVNENSFESQIIISETGTYTFSVREAGDATQISSKSWTVYEPPTQGHLVFGAIDDSKAYVDTYWLDETGPTGNVVIPQTMAFADGKTRTVTAVSFWGDNASSISIPACVTDVLAGIKDYEYYDYETDTYVNPVLVPGFVIYGTNGTAAQAFANKYGIAFRDLAAEAAAAAEAARQGTPGSLPKVKASKPKAAKKAITVKWKKLNKKQLKSGVSNIEVWVCSDGAFANGSTIEKVVGKKKASLKIKGLQKGVTYYVKVRAITYSGGTKIVGPWSAVKKVKVKK